MKNTIKLVLAITVIALCSNVSAQNLKLAYINMNELIVSMPEYESASAELQKVIQGLQSEMEEMQVEYNRKLEDYNQKQAGWADLVKQSKTEELIAFQQRIQSFQQQAEESLQQEEAKLMQPVYEKANKAIETVAKEQGVTGVINDQVLLYKDATMINLLSAVQKHLGIDK
jgi:outer membrane protein